MPSRRRWPPGKGKRQDIAGSLRETGAVWRKSMPTRKAALEREKKMLEQTIAHLQEVNRQGTRRQLTALAERAKEGAAKLPLLPEAEPKA